MRHCHTGRRELLPVLRVPVRTVRGMEALLVIAIVAQFVMLSVLIASLIVGLVAFKVVKASSEPELIEIPCADCAIKDWED